MCEVLRYEKKEAGDRKQEILDGSLSSDKGLNNSQAMGY
jgi:hypothetical protein